MKVLPEYFDPSQFIVPQYDTHFTIKRPYTNFAKSMRLNFQEYYSNLKLQCIIFDRIWQTCLNMYGYRKATRHHRCFETKNYMEQCIAINKFIANDKKYYPERYATSEFNVVQPSPESVYLPSN